MAAVLGAAAVFLAVSGGFRTTVGGLRLSARSPLPILFLALINFSVWLAQARRANAVAVDLERAWDSLQRHSKFIVAIALVSATVVAVYSTRSAAGADASGYLSQAAAWTETSPPPAWFDAIAEQFQGFDAWLTTPLGWRPDETHTPGVQVPTYPPGLPLLMALPHALLGIDGAVAIVIICAAAAVAATGLIATQVGSSVAGIIAAALIAFTPVFIFQSIQPMSDVPVTAAWMLCFALLVSPKPRPLAAGVAGAIALLIRPNLAPLAIVPLFIASSRIAFAVPMTIAAVALAFIQLYWYGSPLRSGYGATEELFALSNVVPNIGRYSRWWLATAPALFLGIFGLYRLRSDRTARAMVLFGVLVIGAYLIYAVFDDWSYLRFLLPTLAIMSVFAGIALAAWIERWPITVRVPLLFVVIVGLTGYNIAIARSLDTFKLADQLARVETVADYVSANVDPAAVFLAGEQSGAMRYYTRRPILRWEAATPEALNGVLPKLEQSNRPVFVVLDAWEEPLFRAKLSAVVPLDWPPMLEAGTTHRTRVWRLQDRTRHLRGEPVDTIRLR